MVALFLAAMMVACNRPAEYGRANATYGDAPFSLTANAGYGMGEMYSAVNERYLGPGHVVAVSLGGASRLTHYAMVIAEGAVGQGTKAPFQGTLATGLAGVRLHGKQVAFDAGVVGCYINDGDTQGGIPLPWVGLFWLDP